jgi:hypothetical protein
MAGLVPAIHAFQQPQAVDARHKAGHDEADRYTFFITQPAASTI